MPRARSLSSTKCCPMSSLRMRLSNHAPRVLPEPQPRLSDAHRFSNSQGREAKDNLAAKGKQGDPQKVQPRSQRATQSSKLNVAPRVYITAVWKRMEWSSIFRAATPRQFTPRPRGPLRFHRTLRKSWDCRKAQSRQPCSTWAAALIEIRHWH